MRSENWLSFLGRLASNKSDSILYYLIDNNIDRAKALN